MNSSVNFGRGFKNFLLYLCLSGILGFGLNYFLQQKLQHVWAPVAQQLRLMGLDSSSPRLVFSRSGMLVLGAQIDIVRYEKTWKCFDALVVVKNLFVPVSVTQLMSQKVKLGRVDIQELKLDLIESLDCQKKQSQPVFTDLPQEKVTQVAQEVTNEILNEAPSWLSSLDEWFARRDIILAQNPLGGLVVRSLTVDARNQKEKQLLAQGKAEISFKDHFKAAVAFKPLILRKKEKSLSTEFTAEIHADEGSINLLGDWGFHEGHFTAQLSYLKDQSVSILLKSRDLPVSVVNRWMDTDWSFQFLWFNCQIGLKANKSSWKRTAWTVDSCGVNGPHGQVLLADKEMSSLKKAKDLKLSIQDLQLDKVIHGRDNFLLSGVFKAFGTLSGTVDLKDDRWFTDFELKNPNVIFSSSRKRRLQEIPKIRFQGDYDAGLYSLRLTEAELLGGEFKGEVRLDYNERNDSGKGVLEVQRLSFAKEIQELMLGGEIQPLKLKGDFVLGPHWQLKKAGGQAQSAQYQGAWGDLKDLQVISDWQPDQALRFTLAAGSGVLKKTEGTAWLFSSMANHLPQNSELPLHQLYAQGNLHEKQVFLENATAGYEKLKLKIQGQHQEGKSRGTLSWAEKNKTSLDWSWSWEKKGVRLTPQQEKLKEWLQIHPEYLKENPSILLAE